MELRIRLAFIALLALLPFLTGSANAIDSSALASQLAGEGCSYVTSFEKKESYKSENKSLAIAPEVLNKTFKAHLAF